MAAVILHAKPFQIQVWGGLQVLLVCNSKIISLMCGTLGFRNRSHIWVSCESDCVAGPVPHCTGEERTTQRGKALVRGHLSGETQACVHIKITVPDFAPQPRPL